MNFTDDFNRAVLGANWQLMTAAGLSLTTAQIVSNRVRAGSVGTDGAIEIQRPSAGGRNQWAEITVPTLAAGGTVRSLVRANANTGTGYVFEVTPTTWTLYKRHPDYVAFSSGALTFLDGSTVTLSAVDTYLRGYVNGALVVEDNDDELTSGQPGFGIQATSTLADAEISAFRSGLNQNRMYPTAMRDFTLKAYSWLADTFKVMLVNTGYVFSVSHEFVDAAAPYEVTGTGYVGGFGGAGRLIITNPTEVIDTGVVVLSGDDLSYASLNVGTIGALLIIHEVSVDADSQLIAFINSGFPALTTGGTFPLTWSIDGIIRAHDIRVTG